MLTVSEPSFQKDFTRFSLLWTRIFSAFRRQRCSPGQIELDLPGYHKYFNYAEKKGYSGTAVFSKEEPAAVTYGIGIPEHDTEGPRHNA